jgi:hypothetical protein
MMDPQSRKSQAPRQKGKISETIYRIFHTEEIDDKNKVVYRVVKWNNGQPKFEVRPYYLHENGQWYCGRLGGLTLKDMRIVEKFFIEVKECLEENQ